MNKKWKLDFKEQGNNKKTRVDQSDKQEQGNEWVQIKIRGNTKRNEQLIDDGVKVDNKEVK